MVLLLTTINNNNNNNNNNHHSVIEQTKPSFFFSLLLKYNVLSITNQIKSNITIITIVLRRASILSDPLLH